MIRYTIKDNTGEEIGGFNTYGSAYTYLNSYVMETVPYLNGEIPEEMKIKEVYIYKEEWENMNPEATKPPYLYKLISQELQFTAHVV